MHGSADMAWQTRYEAERNDLLLQRLRWAAGLAFAGGLALGTTVYLVDSPDWMTQLRAAATFTTLSLLVAGLAFLPGSQRRAVPLSLGFVLVLVAAMAGVSRDTPGGAVLIPAQLVATMLGTTLLLPWGAGPQAIVCVGAATAFAWVTIKVDLPQLASAVALVVSSGSVSIVGARLVDRYRAAWSEQTWVYGQLVASARTLAGSVETDAVVAAIVTHASQLVPADSVVVALRDARRGTLRVAGTTRGAESTLGLEVPEELEPVQQILAESLLCLPEDRPTSPINVLLQNSGTRHVLYTTLRHAASPVGVLAFVRRTPTPFSEAERRIVRGLSDQAALALATARVVADLRTANQLKTEFVSTMSHELRTPLNVILGLADMLDDDGFGPDDRRNLVARVRAAGRDLLELIENTLAIGRMDAERDGVRLEDVWLPDFWAALRERCTRMPRPATVDLVWSSGVPPVRLHTDPHKLSVVVANLVSNALKFTECGRVDVTLASSTDGIAIGVADTGIGIAPENQEHVFDMFRQVDSSDSRRYGGAGLGLYIVRRFVEQLGGTIELASALDRGSTFTVRLTSPFPRNVLQSAA